MTDLVEVFAAHGVHVTNEDLRHAAEQLPLINPSLTALPVSGETLYAQLAGPPDPRSYGRQMAAATTQFAALLAETMSATEAADEMGINSSRVRQLIGEGRLWAIKDREWRIPRLQIRDGRILRGLSAIVQRIPRGTHPLSVYRFLTLPQPELEIAGTATSVIDWLVSGGDLEPVEDLVDGWAGAAR